MSNILHSQERPRVLEHVGGNVRTIRQQRGLSQEALAQASDVSRRMIVGIEKGDANISLGTLDRLAEALDVRFGDLVQAPASPDPARIEALAWAGMSPESRGVLLSSFPAEREVEIWQWTLAPGEIYEPTCQDTGWTETVYVVSGTVHIGFPDNERVIEAGDFQAFSRNRPRRYANRGETTLTMIRALAH